MPSFARSPGVRPLRAARAPARARAAGMRTTPSRPVRTPSAQGQRGQKPTGMLFSAWRDSTADWPGVESIPMKRHLDPVIAEYAQGAKDYDRKWSFYVESTTRETLARLAIGPTDRVL